MNLNGIRNVVTSKVARQLLVGKKHSPTILFAGGVVGMVGTTVLASRATLRLEDVLLEAQRDMAKAKEVRENFGEKYSEGDMKRDQAFVYVRSAFQVTKLYAPAFILGALSVAALTGSHNILTKRNAGLTAAYAAAEKGFKEYRQRVIDELGPEKDREFRYGSEERTVIEEHENGKVDKIQVKSFKPGGHSMYAKLFDEFNKNWSPNPDYNIMFLRCQQTYANDRLRAQGHLLLNDVYEQLGMERTKAGCVVGWIWDPNSDLVANEVDFGIWDDKSMERLHDFVVGREKAVLLDFNVDGVIYDKI